jgi:hypothetical protein
MPSRPPLHVIAYGDSGAKKSTFAASFPKPALVLMADPYGKEMPYCRRGVVRPSVEGTITLVESRKDPDKLLIQIEHYLDGDMKKPDAFARLLARLSTFDREYGDWATVVFDSATFFELAARKWHQYALNPTAREPRQWFAGSTDLMEEMIMGRLAALPMNVVVICHVDEDKDEVHGTMVRNPKLPGRLRKGAAAGYSEMYRLGVRRTGADTEWFVQTQIDALFNCASQVQAPNGCEPDYNALWANFDTA